jgi:hypothetical protein
MKRYNMRERFDSLNKRSGCSYIQELPELCEITGCACACPTARPDQFCIDVRTLLRVDLMQLADAMTLGWSRSRDSGLSMATTSVQPMFLHIRRWLFNAFPIASAPAKRHRHVLVSTTILSQWHAASSTLIKLCLQLRWLTANTLRYARISFINDNSWRPWKNLDCENLYVKE